MDYRFKRSFQLAAKLEMLLHRNFKYLRGKGERVHFLFNENEVDQIFYFFPDPWPKTRHHKKRLFQQPFLEICHQVLKPGGKLMIKTDHDGYAKWMNDVIEKQSLFKLNMKSTDLREEFPEHFLASYKTKFEKIFLQQGIKIKAFELENIKG
jgi:tRNA (guanine-N7-)-methyltransferase